MGVEYTKRGNKRGWKVPPRRYRKAEKVYEGADEFSGYEGDIPASTYEMEEHKKDIPAKLEYNELFPNINATSYGTLRGREFIKDLLSQTRGQLIVSLSRMTDRDFAKTWIELNKFVMPQMTAADVQVTANNEQSLYEKMREQVKDEEFEASTSRSSYGIEQIDEAQVIEEEEPVGSSEGSTLFDEMSAQADDTTPPCAEELL